MLVHDILDGAVAQCPDARAVQDRSGAWSYARLGEYSQAFSRWLRRQGVEAGDRVVVRLPTTRELVALFYGTSRHGAVFVPLNPEMKTFQLGSVVESADPALVISDAAGAVALSEVTSLPVHDIGTVWAEVEALRAEDGPGEPAAQVAEDALAVLIYTSGSTSAPKAVMGPHAQVTFAASAIQAVLGYRHDDVVFCRFPMSWDYGLYKVLLSGLGRSELVLAGEESDLMLLRRMCETGTTVVPVVPSLASMITTLVRRDPGSVPPVRMVTNTGAALPRATIEALRAAFPGVRVVRQFGQTECKRVSIVPPEEDRDKPGSVGLPLPGTEVLILDAEGNRLPAGETGEIVAVGPHVMPGYWRAPELTARTFRREPETGALRLHTGDYGRLDDEGYLYFEGRRDDIFKRKGVRMSTVEIEAAAMDIPGVRAATALPPSDDTDLSVCVESDLTPQQVLRELSRRLEPQKVPSVCHVVDELPLTVHGKQERRELARTLAGARR
ncbi:AMP-binding protein [Streptomyces sp. CoH17]|uniref:AMP-binding protein n=1 Tax=Streptomyces sp. CoH17 TaxID=2992806 RepID=UPI00226F3F27|nr:AMP-binding protein [Streptomyces sp. CoH17]